MSGGRQLSHIRRVRRSNSQLVIRQPDRRRQQQQQQQRGSRHRLGVLAAALIHLGTDAARARRHSDRECRR